ncbi:MAG: RNA polymerase sigma factor [Candidatus Zipacnadales bacterium]
MPASDEHLAQQALRGDEAAFDVLVRRYYPRVLGLCRKLLGTREAARDATQEAFIRAYCKLPLYDPTRRFSAWLMTLTARLCVSLGQRQHRELASRVELGNGDRGVANEEDGPVEVAERSEVAQRVCEAIRSLPDLYKPVCILRHMEGLSYQEIAEATGLPLGTVKVHLFRAKTHLRAKLADLVDTELM